jgi:hypothetical protein
MYVLTKFGNAKLQSLTLLRLDPKKPKETRNATKTWVPNVDPNTGVERVPSQPTTAEVRVPDLVLDGRGSGSEWEIVARVSASTPALLEITLTHIATGAVTCRFRAKTSGGSQTTAVEFTE